MSKRWKLFYLIIAMNIGGHLFGQMHAVHQFDLHVLLIVGAIFGFIASIIAESFTDE